MMLPTGTQDRAGPVRRTWAVWNWAPWGPVHRNQKEERPMGTDDKLQNAAEEAKGKVKEKAGEATDDRDLQADGEADQTKANLKQAGEKVKDAFKD